MAIVDDLTTEVSFRRFYLRWLVAVAVTLPFAAVAVAFWAEFMPIVRLSFAFGKMALPLFWLLVALGQWRFMRRYSSSPARWVATFVLAGLLASFVLFFASGLSFIPTTGMLFPFLIAASALTKPFDPALWLLAVGGAGFGFVLALALSRFIATPGRRGWLWVVLMTLAGGLIFASLWPLCDAMIRAWIVMRFPPRLTAVVVFAGTMGAPTGLLLAGWILWSSVAGLALWHLRTLRARALLARANQVFE